MKRELAAQERLQWHAPVEVKKMDDDEGEKFFLDYWGFGDEAMNERLEKDVAGSRIDEDSRNTSLPIAMLPAIAPHIQKAHFSYDRIRRSIFKRDFQCPGGTHSCSAIGENNLCCNNGESCVSTSNGIGCCPYGITCGQEVSECQSGYTSCPNSPNGGCCIPGAACQGEGCVLVGTRTVVRTLATSTRTDGVSFTTEVTSGRTVTVAYPTTEISVTTTTVTLTPSGTATTRTITLSGQACQDGFFSCPANKGGGCCPTGQACSADGTCPDVTSSTSTAAGAPFLPTSRSVSVASVESSTSVTQTAGCPTGFYQCSAVYLGGCCRVGRDCHTTSCPPQDTTSIVSNPTVYVTGNNGAAAATAGSCANGWYLCNANENGGCCPSGYQCGVQSCRATVSGQRNTAKMAPSSANVQRWAWSFLGLGVVVGVGMIWL